MSDIHAQSLTGQSAALVTGGSGGIGSHLVRGLAAEGYRVYFTYLRNRGEAEDLVAQVEASGGWSKALKADVRNEAEIAHAIEEIVRDGSQIRVLINNAGVSNDGMSWKLDAEKWRTTFDVNVTGPFVVTKAVLPLMREQRHGRIVNISSVVGHRGVAGTCAYGASKAALGGFTRAVAKEVASRGITVNNLVLGYFDAGMGAQLPEAIRDEMVRTIPAGKFGEADKLAKIVAFLCSDACDYVTGQEIVVDGGFLA